MILTFHHNHLWPGAGVFEFVFIFSSPIFLKPRDEVFVFLGGVALCRSQSTLGTLVIGELTCHYVKIFIAEQL